jgi:hypothetical protein
MYRLHGFCQSSNTFKVAFLLRDPNRRESANEMGEVPVLEDGPRRRVRAIPGWAEPYDVLPGERLVPKWVNT